MLGLLLLCAQTRRGILPFCVLALGQASPHCRRQAANARLPHVRGKHIPSSAPTMAVAFRQVQQAGLSAEDS